MMNSARAPFQDERARRAVALAIDPEIINSTVYFGKGEVPDTLFPEESPFHSDIPLNQLNKDMAQQLFDELAAEGKPVSFSFLAYPTPETKAAGESVQAQLSEFDNVKVEVEVGDYGAVTARAAQRDFDMIVSSSIIQDPDYALWTAFHGDSSGNFSGLNDQKLNDALDAGRFADGIEERKSAYKVVQERLATLVPGSWYIKAAPSVMHTENVHGVRTYTLGSPLPEEIWMTN